MQTPVVLPSAAEEGTAYGAALMAKYRLLRINGSEQSWAEFVHAHEKEGLPRFEPDPSTVAAYAEVQQRYMQLIEKVTG